MSKARLLQPDLVLDGTILELTPAIIKRYQLKGLILDVDETLVPVREKKVSQALNAWVTQMKPLVDLWLVSNNLSKNRIGRIAQTLELPYLLGAGKPSRRKLRAAIAHMELPPQQVAMVGDRLLTDVLAGNRLGLFTILVEPMVAPGATTHIYPIRQFEVWLSQAFGVSLQQVTQSNVTKKHHL